MLAVGSGDAAAKLAFNKIIQPAAQKFQPNIILVSSGRFTSAAACNVRNSAKPQGAVSQAQSALTPDFYALNLRLCFSYVRQIGLSC